MEKEEETDKDDDYEYEIVYDEECEDGEWVDDQEGEVSDKLRSTVIHTNDIVTKYYN